MEASHEAHHSPELTLARPFIASRSAVAVA
jgi:hypothetical protein